LIAFYLTDDIQKWRETDATKYK